MTSECSMNQQRIPQALLGDLAGEEQQALDAHLLLCPSCQAEHKRYERTLGLLQSASDEPVPHHFFVYPEDRTANPWRLFRQMMPRWQIATACFACLLMMLTAANLAGLQIRSDQGKWSLSLGGRALSASDATALKAEILREADERNRAIVFSYIQDVRAEIAATRTDLSQQQQIQVVSAVDRLESRLTNRMNSTADDLKAADQSTAVNLFQTLSLQHQQDMRTMNSRVDTAVSTFQTKARQTDDILDTLLQIANLNLKQPGEQK